MYRVPRLIRFNDNIVVREDEIAVFYRDGKALAYLDRPDRYALTSINAPIVGTIVKALSGVVQQAEVVYLQKRAFDGKFGSKQPYQFRDNDFGVVNLRVFGSSVTGSVSPRTSSTSSSARQLCDLLAGGGTHQRADGHPHLQCCGRAKEPGHGRSGPCIQPHEHRAGRAEKAKGPLICTAS